MGVAPKRRAESWMTCHAMGQQAPQSCHSDEYQRDDGDLGAGMDSKGRQINTDVVAAICYGHERNTGDVSITAVCSADCVFRSRSGGIMAQLQKFSDADQDGEKSEQTPGKLGGSPMRVEFRLRSPQRGQLCLHTGRPQRHAGGSRNWRRRRRVRQDHPHWSTRIRRRPGRAEWIVMPWIKDYALLTKAEQPIARSMGCAEAVADVLN